MWLPKYEEGGVGLGGWVEVEGMCLRLLFRESGDGKGSSFNKMIWVIAEIEHGLSLQVEHCSGYIFYSDSGLHDGGRGSVHRGESRQQGSGEGGVLFSLCLFWAGGITFSFDEEVDVFVQLSFDLLGHKSVLL